MFFFSFPEPVFVRGYLSYREQGITADNDFESLLTMILTISLSFVTYKGIGLSVLTESVCIDFFKSFQCQETMERGREARNVFYKFFFFAFLVERNVLA